MGIRSLIPLFSLAALVAAGMSVPSAVEAGDVKIHLHGHFDFIGHNYGYKRHYGHRYGPHYRHRRSFRHQYYDYPYWYGRKHRYGHRWYKARRYHNPRLDRRHRKHHRRQIGRGFSDAVIAPPPRRRRR